MGSLICFGAIRSPAAVRLELLCFRSSSGPMRPNEISKNLFPHVSPDYSSLPSEMFFASRETHSLVLRAPPKLITFGNSFGLLINSYYSSSSARSLTYFHH